MEDPIESRLRALMRGSQADDGVEVDDARLERVLHKAHLQDQAKASRSNPFID